MEYKPSFHKQHLVTILAGGSGVTPSERVTSNRGIAEADIENNGQGRLGQPLRDYSPIENSHFLG